MDDDAKLKKLKAASFDVLRQAEGGRMPKCGCPPPTDKAVNGWARNAREIAAESRTHQ